MQKTVGFNLRTFTAHFLGALSDFDMTARTTEERNARNLEIAEEVTRDQRLFR